MFSQSAVTIEEMWFAMSLTVLFGLQIDVNAINSVLRFNETNSSTPPNPILKFPTTQICYNFVYFNGHPDRFNEIVKNFQSVHLKSVTIFKSNSNGLIRRAACNLFVILIHYEDDYELLKTIPFRPFSRILIILWSSSTNLMDVQNFMNYWFKKSVSVLFVDYNSEVLDLTDFLNDEAFIDRLLRNEHGVISLRASFFNCPPFVIRYQHRNDKIRYDGIEMRCLREITRNWAVTYRDVSNKSDTWCAVLADLSKNKSDVAMCSVWETGDHAKNYDLSSYINYQCVTILVPKPSMVTQASIIYLPFHWGVWLFFVASLITTAIAIKYTIELELNFNPGSLHDRKYKSFIYVLLELVNISTSHGLFRFPYRLAIQFTFFGWILLMFLLDTGYSTVYTSRMTLPQYSKPIETIQDFLSVGLHWSEPEELYVGIQQVLQNTSNENLINVADRLIIDKNLDERLNLLKNRKIGKIVKVLSNKYVTDLDFVLEYAVTMTPMKECLMNYYTVLALQKDSPYTKIFNRQLGRMKAAGLFHTWFGTLITQHFNETIMDQVLHYHYGRNEGPTKLELKHLSGGFYLLFIGLAASIVTLIFEIYWNWLAKRDLIGHY